MIFYCTERPKIDGRGLKHATESILKGEFPGINLTMKIQPHDRNVDGRYLYKFTVDSTSERDAILVYFGHETAWDTTSVKSYLDNVTGVSWTISDDEVLPPS